MQTSIKKYAETTKPGKARSATADSTTESVGKSHDEMSRGEDTAKHHHDHHPLDAYDQDSDDDEGPSSVTIMRLQYVAAAPTFTPEIIGYFYLTKATGVLEGPHTLPLRLLRSQYPAAALTFFEDHW